MEFSQSLIKVPCSPVTYGVTENYQPLILNSGPSERFPNVIPFRTPLPMTSNQKEQRMEEKVTSILYDEYEEKVRPCIDLIDSLRALGVEKDMALPAIAVIGDQSSGKSSILEALSGVSLPRGSGIVTRCPLVLKLKKLMPQQPWRGKIACRAQEIELQSSLEVEKEINKAQDAIAGKGVGISHELISLEISSPNVPDLTLIDLPGITRVAVGNQPQDIGNQIKSLIRKYIQKQETINLVVVPSNVDIATTEALSMAREVDPSGERTLGVLTKPDLVDQSAEENVVDVIRNLTIHLRKGYMIVKCRGQKDLQDRLSLTAAIEKEKLFFEEHQHFRVLLEEKKATIPLLAERLTVELIEHIKKSLPMLIKQIKDSHQNATEELRKCGTNIPEGGGERMLFLVDKIKLFNQDISALMLGEETVNNNEKRLFTKLRAEFKNWGQKLETSSATVQKVINEEVLKYENQYRGRELPGFVNYSTFETIVKQYIQQLEDPAIDLLQLVAEIVCENFSTVAQRNFEDFSNLRRTAKNKIEELKQEQQEEAERMIRLHFKMEKIIYCQDEKYSSILQQVKGVPPEGNVTGFQTKTNSFSFHMALYTPATELAQHLNAYFKEASNRLTNYIPMMVQFFVLRSFGDRLQKEMMILLQGKDQLDWLLKEQNDTVIKRQFLKEQIGRLTLARRRLSKFLG